jgi:hypothetical protein
MAIGDPGERRNGTFQMVIRLNVVIWSKIARAAIAAPDTLTASA